MQDNSNKIFHVKFTKPKTEKKPYVNCRQTHTHTHKQGKAGRGSPGTVRVLWFLFFGIHTMTCQVQNAKTHTLTRKARTVSWQRIKWQTAECRAECCAEWEGQWEGRRACFVSFCCRLAAPTTSALCWNNHKIKISYWICWTASRQPKYKNFCLHSQHPLCPFPPPPFTLFFAAAASFVSQINCFFFFATRLLFFCFRSTFLCNINSIFWFYYFYYDFWESSQSNCPGPTGCFLCVNSAAASAPCCSCCCVARESAYNAQLSARHKNSAS